MPRALFLYPEFPPSYWGFRYALEPLGKRAPMARELAEIDLVRGGSCGRSSSCSGSSGCGS